jgi:hypothetical protein
MIDRQPFPSQLAKERMVTGHKGLHERPNFCSSVVPAWTLDLASCFQMAIAAQRHHCWKQSENITKTPSLP